MTERRRGGEKATEKRTGMREGEDREGKGHG